MRRRYFAALVTLTVFTACQDTPVVAPDGPMFNASAGDVVPGRFIVTLRAGANPSALANEHGIKATHVYRHALNGFAGAISTAAREGLMRDNRVVSIEPDAIVEAFETQSNATWGLDRIDQRTKTLDQSYNYSATGAGVVAYIIDSGIRTTHTEFGGRATVGFDAIGDGNLDCNGHGTHVAGTVGGSTYGVAKEVQLVSIRVLSCSGSGTTSGVIAGVDHVTGRKVANPATPMVANMSLGGGASSALDQAVANSIAAGVTYAIAAGNGNKGGKEDDACKYSPARVPEAITIGATDRNDTKTSWSNYGPCVDWFAPGSGITSAWIDGDNATNTISGTSMATPHVAGVAALYLQVNPTASAQAVRDGLYALTTKGVVLSAKTTDNHLLYSDVGAPATPPGNGAPTARFTFACTLLDCVFTDGSTDADGTVVSWSWDFGDGASAATSNASHTFGASGSYQVTLTITDNEGANGNVTKSVVVSDAPPAAITLTIARAYKVKGNMTVDLAWSGASGASVDIWRQPGTGAMAYLKTVANTGTHTDRTNYIGSGTLTYRVCLAGSATVCSSDQTATF